MKPLPQITSQQVIDFLKKVDKKTWIKTGIVAAGVILSAYFIIIPAWFVRPQMKLQVKMLEGQISLTRALFLKQPMLLKNKTDYARFIAGARERLYKQGESSLLLGVIAKMATDSGVSVVASMPKDFTVKFPAPYDKEFMGNRYDFTVEGGYHNLGQFVSRIESNAKLLRIETFTLKSRAKNPGSHLAEVSMSAVSTRNPSGAQ